MDEIKNQASSSSQLKLLEGNVAADYHLITTISEDIKRMYRADTVNAWAKDSLIAFMSRRPGLYDKYELATIYLNYGQYTDMQTVLSYIDNHFELEEELQTDYNDFVNVMNIAKDMQENNLYEEGLSETQRTTLQTILSNDRPLTSSLALALLKRDNPAMVYNEPVYDITQNAARKSRPENNQLVSNNLSHKEFKLYPNPAIDYTTLVYNCKFADMSYSITDMQGRVLTTVKLQTVENMNSREVLIDLQGLSPGTYHFVIKTGKRILWNDKLIINN